MANKAMVSKGLQEEFAVRPLSWRTGSEILDLDLSDSASITDHVIERLKRLVGERCIVLFRDQKLSHDQHLAFTRRFGSLAITGGISRYSPPGYPDIFAVSNKLVNGVRPETAETARIWHSDQSFQKIPPMGSLLYCIEAPLFGGTTIFANMYQAYEALSAGLQRTLSTLKAVHDLFGQRGQPSLRNRAAFTDEDKKRMPTSVHPVVLRHSLTGLPALYCSDQLTDRFEGWTFEESKPILDYLHAQATQPAYTYRHAWKPGDLVFWDNRCTNHYAPPDYDTHNMDAPENHRLMYRTTIAGDPIVSAADSSNELRIAS